MAIHVLGGHGLLHCVRNDDGFMESVARQALGQLKAAGLHVIPITGRPIGWSEPFARGEVARAILGAPH